MALTLFHNENDNEIKQIVKEYSNKFSIQLALWLSETACFIQEQSTSGFEIFALEFSKLLPKSNKTSPSSQRPLLATAVLKLSYNNQVLLDFRRQNT